MWPWPFSEGGSAGMKIYKTVIQQSDDGSLIECDTIEYNGKLWLVPAWNIEPDKGTERPARLIGLQGLPLQKRGPDRRGDYLLLTPLSKAILAGVERLGFDVIEAPQDVVRKR
jgi:hypothetical protein